MHAEDKPFSFITTPTYYDVPFFQRAYVWDKDNWQELFENLSNKNRGHFLGSIILKNVPVSAGTVPRYLIIDGQQRLTTLSILLRACYDHVVKNALKYGYDSEVISECKLKMENYLFVSEGGLGKKQKNVKIVHSRLDKIAFNEVIQGIYDVNDRWEKIGEADDEASSIVKAYSFFRLSLNEITPDMFSDLWEILTGSACKFLVNINLAADDDEQAIFDTVNSSGVRLSSEDTIKNLLYQRYVELLRKEGNQDVEKMAVEEYEKTWEAAFLKDEQTKSFWDLQKQYGRMKRSNLETFLHSFAVVEGFFNPSDNNMDEMPRQYREHVSKMGKDEIEEFFNMIRNYASVYAEYFAEGDEAISFDNYIGRIMNICTELEVSTFYPYILQQLYLFKKKELNASDLYHKLFELERYIVITAICKGSTKNYNKECLQLVENKKKPEDIFAESIYISEDSFKSGLRKMTMNKFPTLLLFWVELYLRSKAADYMDVKELKYVYTLEHIMPQKWEENWSSVNVYGVDGQMIESPEEAENVRRKVIYEIGNMTLLKSKLNSSVSNGTFNEKKEGKNGKKGLKDIVDLKITKEVIEKDYWDERTIRDRTSLIEDRIREIWAVKDLPADVAPKSKEKTERSLPAFRLNFWKYVLPIIQEKNNYESFNNNTPGEMRYVNGAFGISGFSVSCTASYEKAQVDFYMGHSDENKNKKAFDILFQNKAEIEQKLEKQLNWDRGDGLKSSWITCVLENVNIANTGDWPKIADFLGEWSAKLRRVMVPYLVSEFPPDLTGKKTPDEIRRLMEIASILLEWTKQNTEIIECPDSCNRSYTRFMTKAMSDILPDIQNARSGWNTDNHYFYEIVNNDGKSVEIQLGVSFQNTNDEFRAKCRNIETITGRKKKENSNWWVAYKTTKVFLTENLDKELIFTELNKRLDEIKIFEEQVKMAI